MNPTGTSSYTVTGTNANGCVSSGISTITVNSLPNVTAITSATMICAGASSTLTAGGATTYLWNQGTTTATLAVNPAATTSYTVIGTDVNNCANRAVVTQSVNLCTGIENLTNEEVIRIYPNPATNLVSLNVVLTLESDISLKVYNTVGQMVYEEIITVNERTIDCSNWGNGLYIFVVSNKGTTNSFKIIKE